MDREADDNLVALIEMLQEINDRNPVIREEGAPTIVLDKDGNEITL